MTQLVTESLVLRDWFIVWGRHHQHA